MQKKDMSGCRFGKLVAIEPVAGAPGCHTSQMWRCWCDCGQEINAMYYNLLSGNNKSCGCLKEESQKRLIERMELVDGTCIEWLGGRKRRNDNRSGCSGVFKRKNGTYIASIGFKKKLIYLGAFKSREEAIQVRREAEDLIYGSFLERYQYWKDRAEKEPDWAKEHPFHFDVEKQGNQLIIDDSMKEFMDQDEVEGT